MKLEIERLAGAGGGQQWCKAQQIRGDPAWAVATPPADL